ncbi:helix-turn-helix transcriptional regulator [Vibrio sp. M60_M70]
MINKKTFVIKGVLKGRIYTNSDHIIRVHCYGIVSQKGTLKKISPGDTLLINKNTIIIFFFYSISNHFLIEVFNVKNKNICNFDKLYKIVSAIIDVEESSLPSRSLLISLLNENLIEKKYSDYCENHLLINVKKIIMSDIKKKWTVADLCRKINMSESSLLRKLKSYNLTYSHILTMTRIELAAKLLKTTNYQVSRISDCVGFNSVAYFSKKFKDTYGITPREFRAYLKGK